MHALFHTKCVYFNSREDTERERVSERERERERQRQRQRQTEIDRQTQHLFCKSLEVSKCPMVTA